jgi:hypothetical protein
LEWVLSGAVVPIRKRDPSIPSPIAEVIDRALADDLGQRYQNAGEMYQAFSRALQKVK